MRNRDEIVWQKSGTYGSIEAKSAGVLKANLLRLVRNLSLYRKLF